VAKDKFHGSALTSVVCPIFWALLLHSAVIGIDEWYCYGRWCRVL